MSLYAKANVHIDVMAIIINSFLDLVQKIQIFLALCLILVQMGIIVIVDQIFGKHAVISG
jgi:hypothetical protein